jgi:hypothetical protein
VPPHGRRLGNHEGGTEATERCRAAAERAEFTRGLTGAIAALAARYHDATAPAGRPHRVVLVAHPTPAPAEDPACP